LIAALASEQASTKSYAIVAFGLRRDKAVVPRLIEIAKGDLPRNFLGKVLRKDLRT
jgi:hypothetical protein